jgi:hypothetical protein
VYRFWKVWAGKDFAKDTLVLVPFTPSVMQQAPAEGEHYKVTFSSPKIPDMCFWLCGAAGKQCDNGVCKPFWHVRKAAQKEKSNMKLVDCVVDLGTRKAKGIEPRGQWKTGSMTIPIMRNSRPLKAGDELIC